MATNALINSSSPYLQQHAHNPVNWYPWGKEALEKAVTENKLIIISIGYSACHWCHVMEHESFENDEVAAVMNEHFISIKIDREERPDIDAIYMEAIQMLSGQGGWPLNCIALPDQKPVYGGTYFPKEQWISVLIQLAKLWKEDPQKCRKYADQLTDGMQEAADSILPSEIKSDISFESIVDKWSKNFDRVDGGMNRAPKFPMPDNYRFLLAWSKQTGDKDALNHAILTLKKMACGGINDQLGGGFARYSTDVKWKVPHFEKMLYDNAQLVTLYSEAWQATKDPLFKEVVEDTIEFINRELTSSEGGFYSALDADSEGVEGKFYVWTEKELREVITDDFELFSDYFNVNATGYWEHGNYILMRNEDALKIAAKYNISEEELKVRIKKLKKELLSVRDKRIRPALDNKILCSWNALMMRGFAVAGIVFDKEDWISIAEQRMKYLLKELNTDGELLHQLPGENEVPVKGFIDDYAFTIEALLTLYQVTFNEDYIQKASELTDKVIENFNHKDNVFFYFTADNAEKLLQRRIELQDNVTPSGNAVMSWNLYTLGILSGNLSYTDRAVLMMKALTDKLTEFLPWYSRWGLERMLLDTGRNEIVFAGEGSKELLHQWMKEYHPESLVAGAEKSSNLSLVVGRIPDVGPADIYVCRNRACSLPVKSVQEAAKLTIG